MKKQVGHPVVRAQSHTGVPQDGIEQVFRHHAQRALPNVFAITLGKVGIVPNCCLFHLIYGIAAPRTRLEQFRLPSVTGMLVLVLELYEQVLLVSQRGNDEVGI